MLGHKLISWPGTMPEKQPAEPVKYLASKDYYHRHVLNPEGVAVYVPEGRDAETLPEAIKTEIRRQLKGLGNQRSERPDRKPRPDRRFTTRACGLRGRVAACCS